MYHHVKKLMYTVNVGTPDPAFGKMLLEQFGGANGELAAAMQYSIQAWNCEDAARKDLLMDIGTEELSHLEVVGALIRMHMKPMKIRPGGGGGRSAGRNRGRRGREPLQLRWGPRGPRIISRSRAIWLWICGATSRRRRGQRSSMTG